MSRISALPLQAKHIIVLAAVSLVCLTSGAATTWATGTISGKVTDGEGHALSGVTITVTGGSYKRTYSLSAAGTFACAGLAMRGKYTVTPTKDGYTFAPPSRTYEDLRGNFLDQNFVGSPDHGRNTNRDIEAPHSSARLSVLLPKRYWGQG